MIPAFKKLLSPWYAQVLIIAAIILFSYWGLWNTYFQQDEWSGFGKAIYAEKYGLLSSIRLTGFHFAPLTTLFVTKFFHVFQLEYFYYASYALLLHMFNSVLIYIFVLRMTKASTPAFMSAILFAVLYVPSQAVNWYAASFSVLPATFFSLLSLIAVTYVDKRRVVLPTAISAFLLFIALGFKEDVIPVMAVLAVLHIFVSPAYLYKRLIVVAVTAGLYFSIRIPVLLFIGWGVLEKFSGGTNTTSIASNLWHFPLVMTSELSMPLRLQGIISDAVKGLVPDSSLNSTIYDGISKIIRVMYAAMLIYIFKLLHVNKKYSHVMKLLILSTIFMGIGYLPLVALPGGLLPESRHYYVYSVFVVIATAVSLYYLYSLSKNTIIRWISFFVFGCMVVVNIFLVRTSIEQFVLDRAVRIAFMNQVSKMYPVLPDRVIMYNDGNRPFFQSGLGRTLMVQFHLNGANSYQDLLGTPFLYGYYDQEYKELGGKGFGYYNSMDTLKSDFVKTSVPITQIYSFSWDEKSQILQDTSPLTRELLLTK